MIRPASSAATVLLLAAVCLPVGAFAAELTIEITDLRNADGDVRVAVFDKPGEFPEGEERWGVDVPARVPNVVVTFRDVPPGRYAVAVHHDEDRDGEFATNFIGLPREGYGFSRDARVLFRPPVFDAAVFDVPQAGKRIRLRMRY